jgi:hypothetical protein
MNHRIDQKTAAPSQARHRAVRDAAACSRGVFARVNGHRHDTSFVSESGLLGHRAHAGDELLRDEGRRS